MSSATQTDISPNTEIGQTQDSSEKRPEVVIRVRQTKTNDESNKGSTNIELLEALDALDPYQDREDGDHPVTKCGGRIFRTPVFHSSHDESMSGEGEGNGNHNILPKVGICEEESGIVGAIAKWVDRIQSDRNQENKLKWSVLISPHLYADLNLAVKEHIIDYDSLQVFFIGENLPTFILTLYDLTKSSETTTTVEGKPDASETTTIGDGKSESSETTTAGEGKPVKSPDGKAKSSETNTTVEERPESSEITKSAHSKDEGSARKFALQLAQELTVELHKFCCVDFLLLPCAMTYNAFIGDLLHNEAIGSAADTALQQQIEQEQRKAQWYYSGPLQLSESGYREVKEATTLVAGVSYVPYIMSTTREQSAKNKIWLLKLNPSWRRALSLLIEALGSTEDATYTLTCSEDKYRTVEMIVLEAARRWAFSHDVVLRVPTHSDLNLVETKKDLLHLTGKRKRTSNMMQIETMDGSDVPALECRRYRGESETEHLQKKAEVQTSQGGQHMAVNMASSQKPIEMTEETVTMSEEPPDVSEEMNAVPEVKPIEQSFAQMEISSEQAECSAKMEVSTEQAESSEEKAELPEHPEIAMWKERVKEWYPNLSEQAYFVPAVYMNRTQHKPGKIAGQEAYVLQPLIQDSAARDDAANNTVLRCIKQLARGQISGVPKQVMFAISQLEFRNYLNNMSIQSQPNALPRAVDDALPKQNKCGDCDMLIIHREFGVITGEIKSVGDNFDAINLTEAHQIHQIERRVSSAVKQLEKSRDVLKHLVSDYPNPPRIRVTLMVPNISARQLGKVLSRSKQLRERLCGSLGIDKARDPIPECFTSDYVNNIADWWRQCMELDGPDSAMTDELYLDLVARFGGPATTVTVPCSAVPCLAKAHCPVVRTLGEGVVETANIFSPADIVLRPAQLDVIHNVALESLVYLCGPTGTGKTLILILRALFWIQEKQKPVHVVSTREGNMAASRMIYLTLKEMTKQIDSGQQKGIAEPAENPWVRLHIFELPLRMKAAVEELGQSDPEGELFIIVDEACDVFSGDNSEKTFHEFCNKLQERVGKGLHLWAAGMYLKLKPHNFKEAVVKFSLGTPPSITRHVMQHSAIGSLNQPLVVP